MVRFAPIFTEIYRYYLQKFRILIGKGKAGLPLSFDFINPKQALRFNFVNPKAQIESDFIIQNKKLNLIGNYWRK